MSHICVTFFGCMVTVCGTAMWHLCASERDRERRKRVWTTFNISIFAFFPPGPPFSPLTFPHFAALSCLNATCSRCCARTFMHHLPLPGARVRVSVCVCFICGMCCGKRQLLCDLCGSRQSATGEVAGRQLPNGSERESEKGGGWTNRQTAFGACFAFGAAAKYATQNTLQYTAENMYFYLRATTRRMSNGACNVPQKICDIFTV